VRNAGLAAALVRVIGLKDRPEGLLRPDRVLLVLRGNLANRRRPAPAPAGQAPAATPAERPMQPAPLPGKLEQAAQPGAAPPAPPWSLPPRSWPPAWCPDSWMATPSPPCGTAGTCSGPAASDRPAADTGFRPEPRKIKILQPNGPGACPGTGSSHCRRGANWRRPPMPAPAGGGR